MQQIYRRTPHLFLRTPPDSRFCSLHCNLSLSGLSQRHTRNHCLIFSNCKWLLKVVIILKSNWYWFIARSYLFLTRSRFIFWKLNPIMYLNFSCILFFSWKLALISFQQSRNFDQKLTSFAELEIHRKTSK